MCIFIRVLFGRNTTLQKKIMVMELVSTKLLWEQEAVFDIFSVRFRHWEKNVVVWWHSPLPVDWISITSIIMEGFNSAYHQDFGPGLGK